MWHAMWQWVVRLPTYADFWHAFWAAVFGALTGAAAAFELERRREVNGVGRNMLGLLLMEVRCEMNTSAKREVTKKPRRAKQAFATA
jgi:hypothetical protein